MIALNDNTHKAWRETLEKLDRLRRELMGGLGMLEQRQNVWLRQHWRDADVTKDEKLDFPEVVKLCRRLGIESSRRDLRIRFQEADKSGRGFLDFEDFQRFVRLLKRRTEVEAIFIKWADVTISRAERVPGECDTETPSKEVVNASSTSTGSPRLASTGEAPSTMAGAELRNAQGKVADGPPSVSQKGISMSRFSDFLHLEQKVGNFLV